MPELIEDIKIASDWLVKVFAEENLKLDYTIHSFFEIDKFFTQNMSKGNPIKESRLSKDLAQILFSAGAYVGETIIQIVPDSKWVPDETDPQDEIYVSIKYPDGTIVWPMQKVIQRFRNGGDDSIYPYGYELTKEYSNIPFDETFWEMTPKPAPKKAKRWWQIRKDIQLFRK